MTLERMNEIIEKELDIIDKKGEKAITKATKKMKKVLIKENEYMQIETTILFALFILWLAKKDIDQRRLTVYEREKINAILAEIFDEAILKCGKPAVGSAPVRK